MFPYSKAGQTMLQHTWKTLLFAEVQRISISAEVTYSSDSDPSTRLFLDISIGNTMAKLLLWFLTFGVATALVLQNSGHMAPGPDRSELAFNQSEFASGGIGCQCCWQRCDFHKAEGSSILKEVRAPGDVDAWLLAHVLPEAMTGVHMYTSLLETVKEGVESKGAVAQIIGALDMAPMIAGVKAAAAKGKRPLVFTVGHDWMPDVNFVFSQLRIAKEAGAYLVQYNSEPAENDVRSDGVLRHLAHMLKWAEQMGADEVWDYSIAQVEHYPRQANGPMIRYVPPSYTRKLDQGVNLHSASAQTVVLGYLGRTMFKTCAQAYETLLGGRLHEEQGVWTLDDLKKYMEMYPLQLNQHRSQTCLPRQAWENKFQHFESFRMSHVLANKACVISPPAAHSEMKIWKGMVTFVEVEDTLATMDRLAQNLDQCRNNSYETYKREFAAPKVLEQSKFFEAWRPPHGI